MYYFKIYRAATDAGHCELVYTSKLNKLSDDRRLEWTKCFVTRQKLDTDSPYMHCHIELCELAP